MNNPQFILTAQNIANRCHVIDSGQILDVHTHDPGMSHRNRNA